MEQETKVIPQEGNKEAVSKVVDISKLNEIDWNNLLYDLREHEIKILELVYTPTPQPMPFKAIHTAFLRLNYSKRTAKRKIDKLKKIGLIDVVRTVIGIINPVRNEMVITNIQRLVDLYRRRNHGRDYKSIGNYSKIVDFLKKGDFDG